jgi:hypothetical protein
MIREQSWRGNAERRVNLANPVHAAPQAKRNPDPRLRQECFAERSVRPGKPVFRE